jgi:hypothetical protein
MVLFGQNPSQGTLFKASQFLAGQSSHRYPSSFLMADYMSGAEELPVRLAHRVKELDELPYNLSDMKSIKKVKNWYAQSFEVRSHFNTHGHVFSRHSTSSTQGTHQFSATNPIARNPTSTFATQASPLFPAFPAQPCISRTRGRFHVERKWHRIRRIQHLPNRCRWYKAESAIRKTVRERERGMWKSRHRLNYPLFLVIMLRLRTLTGHPRSMTTTSASHRH